MPYAVNRCDIMLKRHSVNVNLDYLESPMPHVNNVG